MAGERELLEGIVYSIDEKVKDGSLFERDSLAVFNSGLSAEYRQFSLDYSRIAQDYEDRRADLVGIEGKLNTENVSKMDLGRVAWNAVFGGLGGSLLGDKSYALIGAAAGAALTLYDESTKSGLDLGYGFFGTLIGSFIGSMYNPVGPVIGGVIGGSIGMIKTGADSFQRKKKRVKKLRKKLQRLEIDKQEETARLMDKTLPKLLTDEYSNL